MKSDQLINEILKEFDSEFNLRNRQTLKNSLTDFLRQSLTCVVQASREEQLKISDSVLLWMSVVAGELAARQNDQEAANIIKDIFDK